MSSELKQQFRPEFLNRLDDIIVFRQLTEPQVRQIVDLDVTKINDRLFERHMELDLTDKAKDLLAEKGFDPLLGARPLRRVIQRDIEDTISEKILMGDLHDNERVIVDAEGDGILGEFTFRGEPSSSRQEAKGTSRRMSCPNLRLRRVRPNNSRDNERRIGGGADGIRLHRLFFFPPLKTPLNRDWKTPIKTRKNTEYG